MAIAATPIVFYPMAEDSALGMQFFATGSAGENQMNYLCRDMAIASGVLIVSAAFIVLPATAQEMMRREGGDRGDSMRGIGTGIGIGIVTGIIINQLSQPPQSGDNPKASKKTTSKKVTKKPKKDQENQQTAKTPSNKQVDNPPTDKSTGPQNPEGGIPPTTNVPKTTEKENQNPPAEGPKPTTPPPTVTTTAAPIAVCGPDITDRVYATLHKIKKAYDDASPKQKSEACSSLYSPTDFNHAWDIEGLDPTTSPGYKKDKDDEGPAIPPATYNPANGNWERPNAAGKMTKFTPWFTNRTNACAIPRPDDACAATVQFEGTCQHAQIVNYVMWGAVNKLCGISSWKANMAILVHGIRSSEETVEGQRQMMAVGAQTVDPPELNPREGMSFRRSILPATPAQFAQCTLTCPVKEPAQPTFNYIWVGLQ